MTLELTFVQFSPPNGLEEIKKTYGDFKYVEMSQGNIKVDQSWEHDNLVVVHNVCNTGLNIQLHFKIVPIFEACLSEAIRRCPDYKIRMMGGYCSRHKLNNPKNNLSVHSFGAAFDFNWDTNTIGSEKEAKTDFPLEFISAFTENGWDWGGNWNHTKDYMHFQYAINY